VLFLVSPSYHRPAYVIGRSSDTASGSGRQAGRPAGMLPAASLTLSHVAKSSSLHLIGDTHLDLFARGVCGYRLSLVTETPPTPYVALESEILRMSDVCDGVSV
jgi:hypothetical protein